jgi:hypothetical protein
MRGNLDAFKVVMRHINDLLISGSHCTIRTSEWAVAVGNCKKIPFIVFL